MLCKRKPREAIPEPVLPAALKMLVMDYLNSSDLKETKDYLNNGKGFKFFDKNDLPGIAVLYHALRAEPEPLITLVEKNEALLDFEGTVRDRFNRTFSGNALKIAWDQGDIALCNLLAHSFPKQAQKLEEYAAQEEKDYSYNFFYLINEITDSEEHEIKPIIDMFQSELHSKLNIIQPISMLKLLKNALDKSLSNPRELERDRADQYYRHVIEFIQSLLPECHQQALRQGLATITCRRELLIRSIPPSESKSSLTIEATGAIGVTGDRWERLSSIERARLADRLNKYITLLENRELDDELSIEAKEFKKANDSITMCHIL